MDLVRCCCWFSKYSFPDVVVVGWRFFWRFFFINFSLARCGPQQASQASSRLVKWLALIVCFAFQEDDGDFITADPALGADQAGQPPDAQLLGEGIPGLPVLSPSSTGMSSTAGRILAFYRV